MTTSSARGRAFDAWAPAVALVALTALALAGCAAAAASPARPAAPTASPTASATITAATPSTTPTPSTTATPTPTPPPLFFATPEAAMRYLARAWNAGDLAALRHVTNPASRSALAAMHEEAVNLRLGSCQSNGGGTYVCVLPHDYPPSLHRTGHGEADLLVAPAARYGWYASSLLDCG